MSNYSNFNPVTASQKRTRYRNEIPDVRSFSPKQKKQIGGKNSSAKHAENIPPKFKKR